MKLSSISFLAVGLILCGCGEKSKPATATETTNAASSSLVTAPVDYLSAVAKGQQKAVGTIDASAVSQAIQAFSVDKGRYPTDLNELVTEKYLPKIPETPYGTKFEYDAAAGTVKVVKQ